jgi:hypothetical protein
MLSEPNQASLVQRHSSTLLVLCTLQSLAKGLAKQSKLAEISWC